jgi:hypothetical protein
MNIITNTTNLKAATTTKAFAPPTSVQVPYQDTADPQDQSELSDLIGPEPPLPEASVYRSALKGVLIGAASGAAIGYGAGRLYTSGLSIPTAANIHFGGITAGLVGGGAILGKAIEPAFDGGTRAVLGGLAGMTFTLVTSTLGVAEGVIASAVGGAIMGGVLGFTGGMLESQEKGSSVFSGGK